MNLNQLETYKLVEGDNHISIIKANDRIAGGFALVTTDIRTLCAYLERYMWERAGGATKEAAHEVALKGMRIIPRG